MSRSWATSCRQAVPSKSTRIDPTGTIGAGYRPGRMQMVDLERLGRAMAAALRAKTLAVPGGEVAQIDGLDVYLSHLPDPAENFAFVATEPRDPDAALADADALLRRNGMPFGIGVLAGRHPSVDAAVRARGHRVLFVEPTMTALVQDLPTAAVAFDGNVDVARGMYGIGLLAVAHVVTATVGGELVGVATGLPAAGAVAVFGVAVAPEARRRGIGAALTCAAARAGDAEGIAWLQALGDARRLYERLGFREVGRT